jgi:hypothetical protein
MVVRSGRCTWCFLVKDVLAGNNMSHEAFGRSCARTSRAWWDIDIVSVLGGGNMAETHDTRHRKTTETRYYTSACCKTTMLSDKI